MNLMISKNQCSRLIYEAIERNHKIHYAYDQHIVLISDHEGQEIKLRLPLSMSYTEDKEKNAGTLLDENNFVIILIQSSHAAVAYSEDGHIFDHKTFSAYMVRKGQGKSQIKHLKTKGKSKAGSRVRLASTVSFFEDINSKLNEIFEEHHVDRIAWSCSKILIPHFYGARTNGAFPKGDGRLYKIPRAMKTPKLKILESTHEYLVSGELVTNEIPSNFKELIDLVDDLEREI